jgi:hypothetical protein
MLIHAYAPAQQGGDDGGPGVWVLGLAFLGGLAAALAAGQVTAGAKFSPPAHEALQVQ